MKKLLSNESRGKWTLLLLYTMLCLDILTLISNLLQYLLLLDLDRGKFISDAALDSNDERVQIIAIIYLLAYITTAIIFLHWFRRAYHNLCKVLHTKHSEGWAAGAWFVPIVSLFWPYQMTMELYEKTIGWLKERAPDKHTHLNLSFVGIWWALWIFSNFAANIIYKIYGDPADIDEFLSQTAFSMFESTLNIILCFYAIHVVQKYRALEERFISMANNRQKVDMERPPSVPTEDFKEIPEDLSH